MSNQITITGTYNLTRDPELRFTGSGQAVANLGLVHNPRRLDKTTNQWVDGTPTFLNASVWGAYAEHVAESLTKGDQVIVIGRLATRTWDQDGDTRSATEVVVDEIGPALRFATAKLSKATRSNGVMGDQDVEPAF